MLISYTLYKIYPERNRKECRNCLNLYYNSRDLNEKGYCKSCVRDSTIDSIINNKFIKKIYINPILLTTLFWIFISISIVLGLITIIFYIKWLLNICVLFLFIANLLYLYSVCKKLNFKKHGNNP